MEGWVGIRVAGQTDWKKFWVVTTAGSSDSASIQSGSSAQPRNRRLSLFRSGGGGSKENLPAKASLTFFASPKPKDKKKPLLTVMNVRQAFAVYPERPEFISRSTLLKLEGTIGEQEAAGSMKGKEGWVLIMPETLPNTNNQAVETLRWLTGMIIYRRVCERRLMKTQGYMMLSSFMDDRMSICGTLEMSSR
jgi:CCR4-NOT transcriptional complex subunit CAF120